MTPDEYCQQKAAASGSSFYYSFLFLPQERRRAITALYAFCREVDDVVDEVSDRDVARAKLAWWRAEVADLFNGHPTHPVTKALQPFIDTIPIERARLNDVIDGMEMDLTHHRYPDFTALKRYCHLVAGVVGEMSARIFGLTDNATITYAHQLGLAFQLTNIIRDVGEDARRGRIYLPLDELRAEGLSEDDILSLKHDARFDKLMRVQYQRANAAYDAALAALPAADRRTQRPGLMMAAIYRSLLEEIRRDSFRVLNQRIALTPLRKLWLAWKTWVAT